MYLSYYFLLDSSGETFNKDIFVTPGWLKAIHMITFSLAGDFQYLLSMVFQDIWLMYGKINFHLDYGV